MDDIEQSLASDRQKKMFYALCKEAGISVDDAQERAKTKYGLTSFNDIQKHQLSELIEKLQEKIKAYFHGEIIRVMQEFSGANWKAGMYTGMTDRTKYIEFLADRLLEEFEIRKKR